MMSQFRIICQSEKSLVVDLNRGIVLASAICSEMNNSLGWGRLRHSKQIESHSFCIDGFVLLCGSFERAFLAGGRSCRAIPRSVVTAHCAVLNLQRPRVHRR